VKGEDHSVAATVGALHEKLVFNRRIRVLAGHLAPLIPPKARVLDIGCGDGSIDRLILEQRPDVSIEGLDVLVRPHTHIPVEPFDGSTIPYPDATFDAVTLVDVLHHTVDPLILLREARRVGKLILIKDHFREGFLAGLTLRFMDWVGNAHHGVILPYNYWTRKQWAEGLESLGLRAVDTNVGTEFLPERR
jgi:SAM-dependent methyltransferase